MRSFSADKKVRLSRFLLEKYEGELSYSTVCRLLRKKDVKINGKRCGEDVFLSDGDEVCVYYDGEKRGGCVKTIYSDENVSIVYKPKGITSERFFERLRCENEGAYFCHRLDRNTDGVMIFANCEKAYNEILKAFKNRSFDKYYHACVYGIFDKKQDVLSAYLIKDASSATVKVVNSPREGAKPIKTAYKVLKEDKVSGRSLIEVELLTGRTHQIRAHLASVGHFVLGDGKYGDDRINKREGAVELCLTAYKLVLHFEKTSYLSYLDGKVFEIESGFMKNYS